MPGENVLKTLRTPLTSTEEDNLRRLAIKEMQPFLADIGVPSEEPCGTKVRFYIQARMPSTNHAMTHSNLENQKKQVHLGCVLIQCRQCKWIGHKPLSRVNIGQRQSNCSRLAAHSTCRRSPDGKHQFLEFEPGMNVVPIGKFFKFNERRDGQKFCVALDCEMVYTTIGEEVATVCLVDGNGNVLIKENIKPMGVVTDYRTPFSGLTESELNEAVYSASEILKKMQDYIGPDTIIVGHGIDNDLLSLRIVHSNVVDTGLVRPLVSYTGTNRRKSLASRVQDAFNEDITVRAKGGPRNKAAEDAQYAMALARVDAASDPAARV